MTVTLYIIIALSFLFLIGFLRRRFKYVETLLAVEDDDHEPLAVITVIIVCFLWPLSLTMLLGATVLKVTLVLGYLIIYGH